MDFNRRILPFYMTYPEFGGRYSGQDAMNDLEYLQQMYPAQVRRFQRRVSEVLDKMDYEGSMIYDEYPDRYSLERLTDSVWNILKREETAGDPKEGENTEKWEWIRSLLFVLVNTEIYKRRHGNSRRFYKF